MQRQLWRGIASSHAWRWALAGEGSVLQPAGSLASRMLSSSAPAAQEEGGQSSWMPNWMKSRLPSALGGEREALKEMEDLTLDGAHRPGTPCCFAHRAAGPCSPATVPMHGMLVCANEPH